MAEMTPEQRQRLLDIADVTSTRALETTLDAQGRAVHDRQPDMARLLEIANAQAQREQQSGEVVEGNPEDYFIDPRSGAMVSREMLVRREREGMNPGKASVVGGTHGLALGSSDEAIGTAYAAAPWAFPEGSTAGERYEFGLENTRALNEAARENPWAYYASLIAGGAGSTLGGWKLAKVNPAGKTPLGTAGRGAGMGATEGTGIGFAEGEGGFGPRFKNAVIQGGMGSGLGIAAAPTAWALQKGLRGIGDMATGVGEMLTGRGNQAKADRAVGAVLDASGRNADDVSRAVAAAAAEGQPDYRMMDALGRPGQRKASGIVRSGGDGAEELAQFLARRGGDASDRMAGFVDDAFPAARTSELAQRWAGDAPATTPRTAEQARGVLKSARRGASDVAYDAARGNAAPVDVRGAVSVIDDRIGGMQGVDIAGDSIDAKLARFRNRLISRNPSAAQTGAGGVVPQGVDATPTSVELSDFDRVLGVKQDVEDAIGVALRAGRNNEARELGKLKSAIDSALEQSSEGYRAANDAHAQMSRAVDAVDEGQMMARRGRPEDTTALFSAMSPDQQVAARAGYGDTVIDDILRRKAEAPDVSREFASSKRKAEAQAFAENPDLLMRRTGREGDMHGVYKRALTGSMTADNLEDIADMGQMASAGRAAGSVLRGKPMQAMPDVMATVMPLLAGTPQGTRTLIARAMMSSNPEAALREAVKSTEMSAQTRQAVATLLRSVIRQPGMDASR